MREFGDICPDCNRQRDYSFGIGSDGKLFGWFTVCLCDKICQEPKVLELAAILSGEKKLED